jgi:hypothetical protein
VPDVDQEASRPVSRCETVRSRRSVAVDTGEEVPIVPKVPSVYEHRIRSSPDTLSTVYEDSARPGSILSHDDVDVYSVGVAEALFVHHISNASPNAHSVVGSVVANSEESEHGEMGTIVLPAPPGLRRTSSASHASRASRFMERFSVERLYDIPRRDGESRAGVVEHVECVEEDVEVVVRRIEEGEYEIPVPGVREQKRGKGWIGNLKKGAKIVGGGVCCGGKTG